MLLLELVFFFFISSTALICLHFRTKCIVSFASRYSILLHHSPVIYSQGTVYLWREKYCCDDHAIRRKFWLWNLIIAIGLLQTLYTPAVWPNGEGAWLRIRRLQVRVLSRSKILETKHQIPFLMLFLIILFRQQVLTRGEHLLVNF